jgi:ABC-type multidrug transport system permease subunit
MNWDMTLAVMRKELKHITRDRMTFALTLLSPLLILIVFGYSFLVEVKDVSTAVVDLDQSQLARRYLDALAQDNMLAYSQYPADEQGAEKLIRNGTVKIALIIPAGFGENVASGTGLPLTVLVDGSEPHAAQVAMGHIKAQSEAFLSDLSAEEGGPPLLAPVELDVEPLYNPDLKPIVGTMPGMIGMALSFMGVAVCAALTREKELGTFEGLVATPIRRSELLIGKLIPYIGTGLVAIALCSLVAVYVFGVPFHGSVVLLVVLSLIFLFALFAFALVLSLFFRTQQAAMLITMLLFMIPPFFLSGLFVPVISMPWWIRLEAMMFPTTPFVVITRGLFLQGFGLRQLWFEALILIVTGTGVMILAILLFHKRLQTGWVEWLLARAPMPAAERRLIERILYR